MGFRNRVICLAAIIVPFLGCSSHTAKPVLEIKTNDPVNEPSAAPPVKISDHNSSPASITEAKNEAKNTTPPDPDEATASNIDTNTDMTDTPTPPPEVNVDPYEKFNRHVFAFNMALDKHVFRPIAHGYDVIMPVPIRKGISNFFANLDMLNTIPNDLLQGKTAYFTADTWRFILNSTLGIGGLFDVATRFGLPKHHEDFGLTLAYWGGECGLKPQPYLMLPILGSTTTRDAFGKIPAYATWPFTYVDPQYYNYGALALSAVDKRADLLPADKLVNDSFDPYIFVRSAYLQSRNHNIEKNRHETNFPPYTTETETTPTEDDNIGNEL